MLSAVGLDPDVRPGAAPHEFSGGQCQRISIARAVMTEPKLIICDEPVSALDVSVQAQILNLLEDMKERYELTLIFIAHDLAVVKNVSDRVAVMYLGKFCEVAPPDVLYAQPAHPYTAALLAAIPVPDPESRPESRQVLGARSRRRRHRRGAAGSARAARRPQEKCADEEPRAPTARRRPVRGVPLPVVPRRDGYTGRDHRRRQLSGDFAPRRAKRLGRDRMA